ncbi:CRISPR-associated endonuclease Cas1 [Paraburkholderia humisilvae]|uniref:CRISPR-associated endonuclease Cas1 n=1 Tax=Paraburkholderia humisilvae TaxID=627669 RepID=A0A6J5DLT4_9BURK|nr:CRISPR-associated endonuclease Cas1 [Paraburkholderia humisilvae]CAB3754132.1 CRISPR-associated endonuclease Cas1 [Paraburkholderia humisilvae]
MEKDDFQHPDFIWTWRETARGARQSLWFPYLQSISAKPRSRLWAVRWNGGELDIDLSKVDFIMVYGGTVDLPIAFLDSLNQYRIVLSIHRRNMVRPYLFLPASGPDQDDILSAQLLCRDNLKSSTYIARTIVREKLRTQETVVPIPASEYKRLASLRSVDEIRILEAHHASRYWSIYFERLGLADTISRRGADHPVNAALDACSFFLHGILLRWVLFHKLSPFHGYLHRNAGYPSLVYDLIEPYRVWMDDAVAGAASSVGTHSEKELTAAAIAHLKRLMDVPVYVPLTRQTVRRKSLLHGAVLALRAWLLDKQTRFVLPVEGEKKGGRPVQVGFKIPGYPQSPN